MKACQPESGGSGRSQDVTHIFRALRFPLVVVAFSVVLSAAVTGASPDQPRVAELARAQSIYLDQRLIIHDDSKRKQDAVTQDYIAKLDMLERHSRERGDLQVVLAVRSEKNRVSPTPDPTVDTVSSLPEAVAKLRAEYDERVKAIAMDDAKAIQALIERYSGHLDNMKRELTRQDRLQDALQVEQQIGIVRRELTVVQQRLEGGGGQPSGPDTARTAAGGDLGRRLSEIQIGSLNIYVGSASSASSPINSLIEALHPYKITLDIDRGALPIRSTHTMHDGRTRYHFQHQQMDQTAVVRRHINLSGINALEALQAICDAFSLGYYLDADTVSIVSAEDPRATWVRLSYTAEALTNLFVENPTRAAGLLQNKQVRISGTITGITRSLSGNVTVQLHATRPVRIELSADADPTQVARLDNEFQQLQRVANHMQRSSSLRAPSTVRRIGDAGIAPQQADGPTLTLTVLAEYQHQVGSTIHFNKGQDIAWRRTR